MTRRDYELLTDVLKKRYSDNIGVHKTGFATDEQLHLANTQVMSIAERLAEALAQDNKAFDKQRFINEVRGL